MKKSVVSLVSVLVVGLFLVGCGKSDADTANKNSDARQEKIDKSVAAYKKSYKKADDSSKIAYSEKDDAITITPTSDSFKNDLDALADNNENEQEWFNYTETIRKLSKETSKNIDSKISIYVMNPESKDKHLYSAKNGKTTYNFHKVKKAETVAGETHKSGKFSFDDKTNTFKTDKLSYKITKVAFMNSAADQSKKTIVFETDITNNTDQELDLVADANAHLYIHAKQKAADGKSNKELQPGTLALDANANSPEQARENTMNTSSILPGKTVQGVFMFDLDNNNNPVVVDFDNAGFQSIAKKTYNVE